MTGFCRITVVAPDVRVDVALPEDVPLAELLPDVLRMADQWQNEGAHSGFALARLDGNELDTGLSLSAQGVRNGDLLYLRAATETLPPPVVASASIQYSSRRARTSRPRWAPAYSVAARMSASISSSETISPRADWEILSHSTSRLSSGPASAEGGELISSILGGL
jgi:hypothetical protein